MPRASWLVGSVAVHGLVMALYGEPRLWPDSYGYIGPASDLAGFIRGTDVTRTPGYPLLLAALGQSLWTVVVLQHAMVMGAALLAWAWVRPVDRWAANVAFWMIGLHPWLMGWASAVMTEAPTVLLLLAAAYVATARTPSLAAPCGAGALVGLAALVRPTAFASLGALWIVDWRRWRRPSRVCVIGLTAGLVLAPWVVRNYVNAGHLGVSGLVGTNVFVRHYQLVGDRRDAFAAAADVVRVHGQTVGDRLLLAQGLAVVRDHPWRAAWLQARVAKGYVGYDVGDIVPPLYAAWGRPLRESAGWIMVLKAVFQFLLPAVVWLGALGGWWAWRRHPVALAAASVVLLVTAVQLTLTAGDSRHRMPVEPFLMVLGALGMARLWRWGSAAGHDERE